MNALLRTTSMVILACSFACKSSSSDNPDATDSGSRVADAATSADATSTDRGPADDAEPFVADATIDATVALDASVSTDQGVTQDAQPVDAVSPDAEAADADALDAGKVDLDAGKVDLDAGKVDLGTGKPDAEPPLDAAPQDSGVFDDASTPDAGPPPFSGAGASCPTGAECNPGWLCLNQALVPEAPPDGLCTQACDSDDDCGPEAFCSAPIAQIGYGLCFSGCQTACVQQEHRTCSGVMGATVNLGREGCVPATTTANDGDACASFEDCRPNQACIVSAFTSPGGYCSTVGCSVGDDESCSTPGATCNSTLNGYPACFAGCSADTDCRPGYQCIDVEGQTACIVQNRLGWECTADADCGPAPWRCLQGPNYPGGYCSGTPCAGDNPRTCPDNSLCFAPTPEDNHCIRQCNSDADCRESEGYKCLSYVPNDPAAPHGCRIP